MSRTWAATGNSIRWPELPATRPPTTHAVKNQCHALAWPYGVRAPGDVSADQGSANDQANDEPPRQSDGDEDPSLRRRRVEAILLLAKTPLAPRKLSQMAGLSDATEARTMVRSLNQTYQSLGRAIRVELIAGGYRMLTLPSLAPWLSRLSHIAPPARLSTPMMETLAVVAYRGPTSRAAVESVRGVACGELLRQLMDRELVRIAGRSEELGRPYLYDTTKRFLQLFGLPNKEALPPIEWQKLQEDLPESISPSVGPPADDSSTNQKEPVVSIAVAPMSATTIDPTALASASPEQADADAVAVDATARSAPDTPAAVIEDEEDDLYEGVHEQDWDDDEDDDDWDNDEDEGDDDEEDDDDLDDQWEEVDESEDEDEDEEWEEDDEEDWDDDDIDSDDDGDLEDDEEEEDNDEEWD